MKELLLAVATDDGVSLTKGHAGSAGHYSIYRVNGDESVLVERRENPRFVEDESAVHGDPKKARKVSGVLDGVDGIVSARFGPNVTRMVKRFLCVVVRTESVEETLALLRENFDLLEKVSVKGNDKPVILKKK